eukprot:COSAG06_NODE_665_length_13274_cov_60.588534_9_plen_100_part_00
MNPIKPAAFGTHYHHLTIDGTLIPKESFNSHINKWHHLLGVQHSVKVPPRTPWRTARSAADNQQTRRVTLKGQFYNLNRSVVVVCLCAYYYTTQVVLLH